MRGTVLRSLMRQDPNVIMVGEIRDEAVAQIVGQAAYTGHLVPGRSPTSACQVEPVFMPLKPRSAAATRQRV